MSVAGPGPAGAAPARWVHVDLGIPAYVHPAVDPLFWQTLREARQNVRFVVVNVHDGPGAVPDAAYTDTVALLHDAGVRTVGYVDTDYGRRPVEDCVDEARTWVSRYGVHGVFLDQTTSGFDGLGHCAEITLGVRAAGAHFVVLNPGTDCHPGYADLSNVVVTFEGSWADHRDYRPLSWMLHRPARRFCHLVHGVPRAALHTAPAEAARRHAGTAFFSDGTGANPWDGIRRELLRAVREPQPAAVTLDGAEAALWRSRRWTPVGTAPTGRTRRTVADLLRSARQLRPSRPPGPARTGSAELLPGETHG